MPLVIAAIFIALLLSPPPAHAATTQPTTRPDPHVWAKRNVELIRQAAARDGDDIDSILGFSFYNPMLARDPYAAQILKILEGVLARKDLDSDVRDDIERVAKSLRLPAQQRMPRSPQQQRAAEAAAVEQRQAARRRDGDWPALALDYFGSAQDEWRQKRVERANAYFDRLLDLLREHPPAADAKMVDSLRYPAYGIARLAIEMGRQSDLDALLPSFPEPLHLELLLGYACMHIEHGRMEQARAVIERRVAPMASLVAEHVLAAMNGEQVRPLAPKNLTTAPVTRAATRSAAEAITNSLPQLAHVITVIADAHARRGDVTAAERVLRGYWNDLPGNRLAHLAKLAADAGKTDVATNAFQHTVELEKSEPMTPAEYEEKARFVREAVKLGMFDWAYGMLSTTADPGARVRHALARTYRARGDTARAEALTEEAIRIAGKGRGEGHVLADIAVDLHAAGQRERAEELLIAAIDHIEGVDFGFSGTGAIVKAAIKMNRLDLLDRCYETYDDPGEKMLLCIVATRAGLYGDGIREDD